MGTCLPSLGRACLSSADAAWLGLSLERLLSAPKENCFCSEGLLSASLALVVCGKWNSKKKFGESLIPFLGLRLGFPCGSACKESPCNAGDLGLIPELGRSPGEGEGYPLQYSGLENSMDFRDQTHTFHSESRVLTTGLPRNSPLKSTLKIVHWCSFQSATIVSFTHIFFFRSVVVIYSFLENCPFHCNFKID